MAVAAGEPDLCVGGRKMGGDSGSVQSQLSEIQAFENINPLECIGELTALTQLSLDFATDQSKSIQPNNTQVVNINPLECICKLTALTQLTPNTISDMQASATA